MAYCPDPPVCLLCSHLNGTVCPYPLPLWVIQAPQSTLPVLLPVVTLAGPTPDLRAAALGTTAFLTILALLLSLASNNDDSTVTARTPLPSCHQDGVIHHTQNMIIRIVVFLVEIRVQRVEPTTYS